MLEWMMLSKPLSVPALTAMIKKFWDTQDDEESTVTTEENSKSEALLDIPMLEMASRTCRTEADHRRVSGV